MNCRFLCIVLLFSKLRFGSLLCLAIVVWAGYIVFALDCAIVIALNILALEQNDAVSLDTVDAYMNMTSTMLLTFDAIIYPSASQRI